MENNTNMTEGQPIDPLSQEVAAEPQPSAPWRGQASQIFREEALEHYSAGRRSQGGLLRISPGWAQWTYWLLIAVVLFGLVGSGVATVDQYASGPAIVRIQAPTGSEAGAPAIVALLPGHYRPLLQPGMTMRVELTGYPYAYQDLTITTLDEQIIGPEEVRRFLGPALADTIPVTGPVVRLWMRPPASTFAANGRQLAYYDGMQGKAEMSVQSTRLLFLLAPGLQAWVGMAG